MIMKRIRNKLRSARGFTLTELIAATLIIVLVTGILASGSQLAAREYHRSVMTAESGVLSSTLSSIIQGELSSTSGATYSLSPSGEQVVEQFFAHGRGYGMYYAMDTDHMELESADGYGILVLGQKNDEGDVTGGMLLVSEKTYTSYRLRAGVRVTCSLSDDETQVTVFQVRLRILDSNDALLQESIFDVRPLNPVSADLSA